MRQLSDPTPPSRTLHIVLHVGAGAMMLVAAQALGRLSPSWGAFQPALTGLGCILLLLGLLHRRRRLATVSARICLDVMAVLLALAALEASGRLLRLDVHRTEARLRRLPPFYRQPAVPSGTVYFRRAGPEVWHGQVIATHLRFLGLPVEHYAGEIPITVRYDTLGFRNEAAAAQWPVVVVGDSFVELGSLPYEALHTTLLASTLQQPVLNLGVSHTGPWTHLHYLEAYGLRPGVRHAVMVFYEGNDLDDLDREDSHLARFARSGKRPEPPLVESSFLRALGTRILDPENTGERKAVPKSALFEAADGEQRVSVTGRPPGRDQLSPDRQRAFEAILDRLARRTREVGASAWIAYMPCKERSLLGLLRDPHPGAPLQLDQWAAGDLPDAIGRLCAAHGVGFIDLTPDLAEDTRARRQLAYNALYDTHLNARGAAIVARSLARRLASAPAAGR